MDPPPFLVDFLLLYTHSRETCVFIAFNYLSVWCWKWLIHEGGSYESKHFVGWHMRYYDVYLSKIISLIRAWIQA